MPLGEQTSDIIESNREDTISQMPTVEFQAATSDVDDEISVADTMESEWSLVPGGDDEPPRVLVVDDEPQILRAVQRMLDGHRCQLLTAEDGQTACDILRRQSVAVLISDERMPGMRGMEVLDFARRHFPNTVRVMLTGNSDVATAIEAINKGEVFRFVTKPWKHDEFVRLVDMAIDQYELKVARDQYEEQVETQNDKLRGLNSRLRRLNDELEERVEERTDQLRAQKQEVDRLYAELQDSFDGVINALLSIMELGGTHVVEHCQRTAARVRMLGEYLEMDDKVIRQIERAALLHWVGLINAPRSLFGKPIEQFDAVEEATWEFHPLLGQQTIRHIPALKQPGRLILHYLHRYDDPEFKPGKPSADEGDQPLTDEFIRACQILAICSFFEQVYTADADPRAEDSDWIDRALKVLEEGSGSRFDPRLVDQFRKLVSRELSTDGETETVVEFEELQPGMVLSRPLETAHGIPVAPRDMIITEELIERLQRFRDSRGLDEIHVWQ